MQEPSIREIDAWGANVHASAEDEAHFHWLDEFFPPGLWSGHPDQPRLASIVPTSAERRALDEKGAKRSVFSLDHTFESHRWVARGPNTDEYFDSRRGALYRFDRSAGQIELIPLEHPGAVRVPLLRTVRELVSLRAFSAGEVLVHGSGFDVGGRGIVVAGSKRAGKTALLLLALRARGVSLVCNDRVFVRVGEAPRASGIPTIFKVRRSTIERFPRLCERLAVNSSWQDLSESPDGDLSLSPGKAAARLGVSVLRETPLAALVFAIQKPGARGVEIRRLREVEARQRLFSEGLFRTSVPVAAPEAFRHFAPWRLPSEEDLARACAQLVRRLRVVECAVGAELLEDASADGAASVVEDLLEQG